MPSVCQDDNAVELTLPSICPTVGLAATARGAAVEAMAVGTATVPIAAAERQRDRAEEGSLHRCSSSISSLTSALVWPSWTFHFVLDSGVGLGGIFRSMAAGEWFG